jgi:hypothetical protein
MSGESNRERANEMPAQSSGSLALADADTRLSSPPSAERETEIGRDALEVSAPDKADATDGTSAAPQGSVESLSAATSYGDAAGTVPAVVPEAGRNPSMPTRRATAVSAPPGALGPRADRSANGRFLPGNRAAILTGKDSVSFWEEQAGARREIAEAVLRDAGHTSDDAPKALELAAQGLAQAVLIRDAAFHRILESGGPLTNHGRARRAFTAWMAATDRVERLLRLCGVERRTRSVSASPSDYFTRLRKDNA